jgi:hypothetical protein
MPPRFSMTRNQGDHLMSAQQTVTVGAETTDLETIPVVNDTCVKAQLALAVQASTERQTSSGILSGALGIVERLRGVSFDSKPYGRPEIGLIAEEVAKIVPEAVAHEETGNNAKAVDYSRLIAVLIEAVKEQQVQIKDHEHSLKEQKGQVARLRAEIERLKTSIRAATVR